MNGMLHAKDGVVNKCPCLQWWPIWIYQSCEKNLNRERASTESVSPKLASILYNQIMLSCEILMRKAWPSLEPLHAKVRRTSTLGWACSRAIMQTSAISWKKLSFLNFEHWFACCTTVDFQICTDVCAWWFVCVRHLHDTCATLHQISDGCHSDCFLLFLSNITLRHSDTAWWFLANSTTEHREEWAFLETSSF